jgi:hypothetical protein
MPYTAPSYITAAEVKARMGSNKVSQVFDDDGSGSEDTDPITFAIKEASALVGALWSSFGQDAIEDLCGDYAVKGILAEMVMNIGNKRRAEFDDPKFDERQAALLKQIREISEGARRLHAEPDVATNQRLQSRGNFTSPRTAHLFAPTRTTPQGGGGI